MATDPRVYDDIEFDEDGEAEQVDTLDDDSADSITSNEERYYESRMRQLLPHKER